MNDRTARIGYLIGSLWLITAVFLISYSAQNLVTGPIIKLPLVAPTVLMIAIIVWTWRRYVRWTVIRGLSTAGIVGLVLAQCLIIWPWFRVSGCSETAVLQVAQTGASGGFWCFICGLIWWNAQLMGAGRWAQADAGKSEKIMSPDVARMAVGLGLVPLLPSIFYLLIRLLPPLAQLGGNNRVTACLFLTALLAIAIWLALWRTRVVWSNRIIARTALLAVFLLAAPFGLLLHTNGPVGGPVRTLYMILDTLPLIAAAAWFAGTAWVWKQDRRNSTLEVLGADQLEYSPHCGECGYSLRGLTEARCPECGWSTTVDDLVRRSLAAMTEL